MAEPEEKKTEQTRADERFMQRALQIAEGGRGHVAPNPMVGAVIVCGSRIIGEGYHRRWGEAHAEVNAVRSVAPEDEHLLPQSTIYVTLEPCSHYGKTPPCAELIVARRFRRVVVGCLDPFGKVSGRGVELIRKAGIDVAVGVLERECRKLNEVFMTAHRTRMPWVTLKWAQSRDGFMGRKGADGKPVPFRFSTEASAALVHELRTRHDAILVGSGTALADTPRLDNRFFSGNSPRRIVLDRRGRCGAYKAKVMTERDILVDNYENLESLLRQLYADGVTSVLVEGGAGVVGSFFRAGLWNRMRMEVAPVSLGSAGYGCAPKPAGAPDSVLRIGDNMVFTYEKTEPEGWSGSAAE